MPTKRCGYSKLHQEVRVVFSDVEMPGSLDGLGLARNICQRWPSIGIVLTSGHHIREEMIPRDGRFVPKPYDGQALVRQIEEIVMIDHAATQVRTPRYNMAERRMRKSGNRFSARRLSK